MADLPDNIREQQPINAESGLLPKQAQMPRSQLFVRVIIGPLIGLLGRPSHVHDFQSTSLWPRIAWAGWQFARIGDMSGREIRNLLIEGENFASDLEERHNFALLEQSIELAQRELEYFDSGLQNGVKEILNPWLRELQDLAGNDCWKWIKPDVPPRVGIEHPPGFPLFIHELERLLRQRASNTRVHRTSGSFGRKATAQELPPPASNVAEDGRTSLVTEAAPGTPQTVQLSPEEIGSAPIVEPSPAPEITRDELQPRHQCVGLSSEQLEVVAKKLQRWRDKANGWYGFLRDTREQWAQIDAACLWGPFSVQSGQRVALGDDSSSPRELWFVGDIHGDLLGFEAVLEYVRAQTKQPYLVFLGDLVDDGPESAQILAALLKLGLNAPNHIAVISGNHEDALKWDQEKGVFVADVDPSTFSDHLNEDSLNDELLCTFVKAMIDRFSAGPVAIFLPDGTFAAHGGVPHSDLQNDFASCEFLSTAGCIQDFIWTRLHPRARRRVPNRSSRSCELGVSDFEGFRRQAAEVLGRPVERMIRGHDHMPERWQIFEKYGGRVITINTMSAKLPREMDSGFARKPCIARWRVGKAVEIHQIDLPAAFVEEWSHLPRGELPDA